MFKIVSKSSNVMFQKYIIDSRVQPKNIIAQAFVSRPGSADVTWRDVMAGRGAECGVARRGREPEAVQAAGSMRHVSCNDALHTVFSQ